MIKQYMDVGAATILVPMVDTAEQAKALVEAMRYPPHGIRGMGGARASRWGRYPQYAQEANQRSKTRFAASSKQARPLAS